MKKLKLTLISTCLLFNLSHAQSRVFKEVGKDMDSKVEAIIQDNSLVGYVIFSKLEKTSADSFNYKLTLMDENLNDIGNYEFENQSLQIQDVAFEQDKLAIAYLRNDADKIKGQKYTVSGKKYSKEIPKIKSSIYVQFLNLDGKLINEYSEPVRMTYNVNDFSYTALQSIFKGYLKNSLKLKNIPGKGFSIVYGEGKVEADLKYWEESTTQNVTVFDLDGKEVWKQKLPSSISLMMMQVNSESALHILRKNKLEKQAIDFEGGYELVSLNLKTGDIIKRYNLTDKNGNAMKVLSFENNVANGKPVLNGVIFNKRNHSGYANSVAKGKNYGVFSVGIDDTNFVTHISNIGDGSHATVMSKKGYIQDAKSYISIKKSFADAEGNNYFVGSQLTKKFRWGNLAATVVTLPTIIGPLFCAATGYVKYQYKDVAILKQDKEGKFSYYTSLAADHSRNYVAKAMQDGNPSSRYENRSFFSVSQNKYLVLDDVKNIFIYDMQSKKVVKTIPHKDGDTKTEIYRAKEGHVMVAEYDKSSRSTTMSIEAL